jgi:AcrR family transcriptional regulator
MATQQARREQTRRALLDAAAELFAERGINGSSVDAIADRAGRTSGALYDHFGSKDGLLFALVERWVDEAATVVMAEHTTAATLEERMAALWRAVSDPPTGGERWIAIEHELWSYASRNETARDHLAVRYRDLWSQLDEAAAEWAGRASSRVGPALIGLLLGLEMMRRVDPDAVTDDVAIAALCGVVTGTERADQARPGGTTP